MNIRIFHIMAAVNVIAAAVLYVWLILLPTAPSPFVEEALLKAVPVPAPLQEPNSVALEFRLKTTLQFNEKYRRRSNQLKYWSNAALAVLVLNAVFSLCLLTGVEEAQPMPADSIKEDDIEMGSSVDGQSPERDG